MSDESTLVGLMLPINQWYRVIADCRESGDDDIAEMLQAELQERLER